jgi:hypothetical protein
VRGSVPETISIFLPPDFTRIFGKVLIFRDHSRTSTLRYCDGIVRRYLEITCVKRALIGVVQTVTKHIAPAERSKIKWKRVCDVVHREE